MFSLKSIALPKAEDSRLRAASAASIVAAVGRSFRLTRSAFSLSLLATKASLPKGLSDHCRSAFDFRLRRTRHWRAVALWKPSGGRPLAAMFFIQHSMKSSENPNRLSCWFGLFVCPSCRILLLILQHPAYSPARLRKLFQRHGLILPRKEGVPWRSWLCYSFPWR